jgi:hypothetical protein
MGDESKWQPPRGVVRAGRIKLSESQSLFAAEESPPTPEQRQGLARIATYRSWALRFALALLALRLTLAAFSEGGAVQDALVVAYPFVGAVGAYFAIRALASRCPRCGHLFHCSLARLFLALDLAWFKCCGYCGLDLRQLREPEQAAV